MKLSRTVTLIAIGLVVSSDVQGQVADRSPERALEDLADGKVDRPGLFIFDGCPQQDPTGQAVFQAIQGIELSGHRAVDLAVALGVGGAYPDCDYPPLNAWMLSTLQGLYERGERGPAGMFARTLEPVIPLPMHDLLLHAAAAPAFAGGPARDLASAALYRRPRERWIEEAIAAFRRPVPTEWKTSTTYHLGREFGAVFFRTVAREAPNLDDATLFIISSAIGSDVRDGHVNPNAGGLSELRDALDRRPNVPRTLIPSRRPGR